MKTEEFFNLDNIRESAALQEALYQEETDPEIKASLTLHAVTVDGIEIACFHTCYADFAEAVTELKDWATHWEISRWVEPSAHDISDAPGCDACITLTDLDGVEHTMSIDEVTE